MLTGISLVSNIEKSRFSGKIVKHDALTGKMLVGADAVWKRFLPLTGKAPVSTTES